MKARVATVAVGFGLIASSGGAGAVSGGGPAEEQIFTSTRDRQVITGKRWRTIRPLTLSTSCADRPAATATVSLQVQGPARRVDLRLVRDGVTAVGDDGTAMSPGRIQARRPKGTSTLAFSFVRRTVVDGHGERFRVQLRSPSGRRLVFEKGSLIVIWDPSSELCE